MRIVKVVALVGLFFVSMVFFIQNNQILSQTMSLQFSLFIKDMEFRSPPLLLPASAGVCNLGPC